MCVCVCVCVCMCGWVVGWVYMCIPMRVGDPFNLISFTTFPSIIRIYSNC